jgi:hypothetical protein
MGKGRFEWRWEVKDGKGRERVLKGFWTDVDPRYS